MGAIECHCRETGCLSGKAVPSRHEQISTTAQTFQVFENQILELTCWVCFYGVNYFWIWIWNIDFCCFLDCRIGDLMKRQPKFSDLSIPILWHGTYGIHNARYCVCYVHKQYTSMLQCAIKLNTPHCTASAVCIPLWLMSNSCNSTKFPTSGDRCEIWLSLSVNFRSCCSS